MATNRIPVPPPTLWTIFCDLPTNVKYKTLCYAGREAAASFCIACPKGNIREKKIIRAAMIIEPFTFFDWNGHLRNDENFTKRRLLWEREKGFQNTAGHKFPTPRGQWRAFKAHVDSGLYDGKYVKKIAVSSWMQVEDLKW
jgi:hypothetical protein